MATPAKTEGGLEDVVATSSAIWYLDGDRGVLAYPQRVIFLGRR